MVSAVIIPQPGANHINIADEVRVRMEQMQKDLPEDVILDVAFDIRNLSEHQLAKFKIQ